jgi:hypothetical protein
MSSSRGHAAKKAAIAIVLACAFPFGCGGEEHGVNPVPLPTVDTPEPVPTTPPADAGPVKRTIGLRNPMGGPAGNLFVDGDFELSALAEGQFGQYGWRAFNDTGTAELSIKVETGGICRTGLRCAVLEPASILFARGAAAAGGNGHVASIWIKMPPGDSCDAIRALLVICDSFGILKKLSSEVEPNAQGWCEYGGVLPPRDSSVCLYLESKVTAPGLLDSAVLAPDDGTVSPHSGVLWPPPPDTDARMMSVREISRKGMRFGRPAGH